MIGEEEYFRLLTALSPKKQLALALLVFERMLPGLAAFSKDTGFDDSCYLQARDAAWSSLRGGVVDQALNQECIRNAPDTENFSHALTSYALNAALAMTDIAEFTLDGHSDHITHVLTLAWDSIDLFLGSLEPSLISSVDEDNRIARHPLMRQEQSREDEDFRYVFGLPDQFDKDVISALRLRANTQAPLLPLAR